MRCARGNARRTGLAHVESSRSVGLHDALCDGRSAQYDARIWARSTSFAQARLLEQFAARSLIRCSDNERNRSWTQRRNAMTGQSVAQYGTRLGERTGGHGKPTPTLSEVPQRDGRRAWPSISRAGVRQCGLSTTLAAPSDCQRFSLVRDRADAGERWNDRLVLAGSHPHFRSALMRRDDAPPDYRAFRRNSRAVSTTIPTRPFSGTPAMLQST